MDAQKLTLPIRTVVVVLGFAAASGGTVALSRADQAHTSERVNAHDVRLNELEKESREHHDRVLKIEVLSEQINKAVERIEKKIDRR